MSNYSINMANCIVKNKEFEVKPYNKDEMPDNLVFKIYNTNSIKYTIVKTGIEAIWNDEIPKNSINFKYKDQTLVTIVNPHIHSVAEYLN